MELIYPETGTNVRVLGTPEAPLFVAADVCAALELTNPTEATRSLDADEKGLRISETPSGPQELLVVTEPGLYRLIMRSRKPEAKRFARWVTHEVLPSIRRTGSYSGSNRSPRHAELDANLLRADLLTAERILSRPPVADTDAAMLKAGARLLLSLHPHPATRTPGRGLDALLPSAPAGAPAVGAELFDQDGTRVHERLAARLRGIVPPPAGELVVPMRAALVAARDELREFMPTTAAATLTQVEAALESPASASAADEFARNLARRLYGDAETAAATRRYIDRMQAAGQLRATADPVLTKAAELLRDLDRPTVVSRVLSFVRTHPGLSGNAVVRGLSLSRTPGARQDISQALRRLEDAGLLRHEPGPRGARLWSPTLCSVRPVVGSPGSPLADELCTPDSLPTRVLAAVQEQPGATTDEVLDRVRGKRASALRTLHRLKECGYVQATPRGVARCWTAAPNVSQTLRRLADAGLIRNAAQQTGGAK